MVIYEDMLHDGIWRNDNLYLEYGRLYANLSGHRWIVLARSAEAYTIQYEMGTLIVKIKNPDMDYTKSLFRIVDSGIDINLINKDDEPYHFWTNPYKNYLEAEKNYSESEKKVVDMLNSQTQGY